MTWLDFHLWPHINVMWCHASDTVNLGLGIFALSSMFVATVYAFTEILQILLLVLANLS